ncbi:hypothetical protein [Antribacter gilvus]|uniref:hypothetical protein n=1 Tax=Antribacter gilvus TaxID=2304675 RepID=UPI000F7AAB42|nr:hypothetical protein [Antribacter gilvus]
MKTYIRAQSSAVSATHLASAVTSSATDEDRLEHVYAEDRADGLAVAFFLLGPAEQAARTALRLTFTAAEQLGMESGWTFGEITAAEAGKHWLT